jgi:hypothetical protein
LSNGTGPGLVPARLAAGSAWVNGLGFGLPCIYAIWYFTQTGGVWIFRGNPTYGEGPVSDAGLDTSVPLLVAFLLVCVAEVVAGSLLWRLRRAGAVLALGLLPLELASWIGFALPFGPVGGVIRTVLVVVAWPSLRTRPSSPP